MGAIVAVIGEGKGAGVTHTHHLVTTPDLHSETPAILFLFVQVMWWRRCLRSGSEWSLLDKTLLEQSHHKPRLRSQVDVASPRFSQHKMISQDFKNDG